MIKSLEKHPEFIEGIWRSSSGKEFFPADINTLKQLVEFQDSVKVHIKLKRWLRGKRIMGEDTEIIKMKRYFGVLMVDINILIYKGIPHYKELWFMGGFGSLLDYYPYYFEKDELEFVPEEENKQLDMVYLVEAL